MVCERSSGKAHYKATKFFDFTAPPCEKTAGSSTSSSCGTLSCRTMRRLIGRAGRCDIQLVLSSQISDPSDPSDLSDPSDPSDLPDLSDIALPPLPDGGRGAILLPGLVITKPGNRNH